MQVYHVVWWNYNTYSYLFVDLTLYWPRKFWTTFSVTPPFLLTPAPLRKLKLSVIKCFFSVIWNASSSKNGVFDYSFLIMSNILRRFRNCSDLYGAGYENRSHRCDMQPLRMAGKSPLTDFLQINIALRTDSFDILAVLYTKEFIVGQMTIVRAGWRPVFILLQTYSGTVLY